MQINKRFKAEQTGQSMEEEKIIGDQYQTATNFEEFTQQWLEAAVPYLDKYNTVYIFGADTMLCPARHGMIKAGFYYSQLLIWIKNTIVLGRKDYLPGHEIILYGWYGRHKMERSKAKSIIYHAKPAKSKLHPTMKPVGLLRGFILNSTKIGETVYDPFGGSGSTLIAAEHTGRKCIMIELEPEYVATIIQRWEILTGKEAVLL